MGDYIEDSVGTCAGSGYLGIFTYDLDNGILTLQPPPSCERL